MPKAYSYIRMSSEAQALRGESLRRQTEVSARYAQKHGLTIEPVSFKDLGVSAFKGEHVELGALGRFLKAVESGAIEQGSYLLVESLDRISRQKILDAQTLFLQIINAGIVLVTISDEMVYAKTSMEGPAALGMLVYSLSIMQRSNEESETKSKRLQSAWENKRRNIDQRKLTSIAPYWLKVREDRKSFDVLEDRAAIVRQIFEDSKDGVGMVRIVKKLNQSVPSWGRAKGWRGSYIKKILSNAATRGIFEPTASINGKREQLDPVENYYPRIISDDLFFAAQASRATRISKGGRRGNTYSNLFTGMATCGYCGSSIRFQDKGNGRRKLYLRCDAAIRSYGSCTAAAWRYEEFEINFISLVNEIDIADFVDSDVEKSRLADVRTRKLSVAAELTSCYSKMEKLTASLENLEKSAQQFVVDRINILSREIDRLKILEHDVESEIRQLEVSARTVAEYQEKSRQLISKLNALDSDELYEVRARLAQVLRESIRAIEVFSDGNEGDQDALLQALQSAGHAPSQITAYREFVKKSSKATSKGSRYYVVHFVGNAVRAIKPDANDPTKFDFMLVSGNDESRPAIFTLGSRLSKNDVNTEMLS